MSEKAIKEAALELFHRFSYSKTTVQDIADAAGVGKGTIYLAFKSKESILKAIEYDRIQVLDERVSSWLADSDFSLERRVPELVELVISEYYELKQLLMSDVANTETRLIREVVGFFEIYRLWFHRTLVAMAVRCRPQGSLADLLDQLRLYADLILGYFLHRAVMTPDDPARIRDQIGPLAQILYERFVRNQ